jgi:hypothetical protein
MPKNTLNISIGAVLIVGLAIIGYSKYYPVKNECYKAVKAQNEAYKADRLAETETFDKYKVPIYTGKLAMLNMDTSPKEVKMFKTTINGSIEAEGVNFAGHYSLVYVGMTGWGLNYFLVDRITGKGVPVPFLIGYVRTQPNSSLLVINPKDLVYSESYDPEFACVHSVTGNFTESDADLRPYYYNWNGSEFIQIGEPATPNPFWKEGF